MDPIETIVLAGYLKRYPRLGSLLVGIRESVASHSFRVAYITFELARMMEEEPGKYVREAVWHDFGEAKTFDHYCASKRFLRYEDPRKSDIVEDADILEALTTFWENNVPDLELFIERELEFLKLTLSKTLLESILSNRSIPYFHRKLRTSEELYPADRIILAGFLKKFPRSDWFTVGIRNPETIADHVFRVMIIADILAREEGADPEEEIVRALLHDLPEAITGDLHRLAKIHVKVDEEGIWRFLGLEKPEETAILKDADKLEFIATAMEYQSIGVKGLERWIEMAERGLATETAKYLAAELKSVVLGDYYVDLLEREEKD